MTQINITIDGKELIAVDPNKYELVEKKAEVKEWPQGGDEAYYLIHDSIIKLVWTDDGINWQMMERGLIFRTEAEAQLADDIRIAQHRINEAVAEWYRLKPDAKIVNWNDCSQPKYAPYWDYSAKIVGYLKYYKWQLTAPFAAASIPMFDFILNKCRADVELVIRRER